jgi:ELWxxDGT repeat protein
MLRTIVALACCCALVTVARPPASAGGLGAPYLVRDIDAEGGLASSYPQHFAVMDQIVMFTSDTPLIGRELWRTDGTDNGTQLVVDLEPGPAGANIAVLTVVGERVFFVRSPTVAGRVRDSMELWVTDGSDAGTVLLTRFGDGSHTTAMADIGGTLLMTVVNRDAQTLELWRSDGTSSGTRIAFGPVTYPSAESSEPRMFPLGDSAIFWGYDPVTGFEPWTSDGTTTGTFPLADLSPGPTGSSLRGVEANPSGALFVIYDEQDGNDSIWSIRTVVSPPQKLAVQSERFLVGLTSIDDQFYFSATTAEGDGELWRSDGTTAGTQSIAPIQGGYALTGVGERLGFRDAGGRVWGSDTTGASIPLTDPISGPGFNLPAFIPADPLVYFVLADERGEPALWRTDGFPDGTIGLGSLRAPIFLGTVGERLFFTQNHVTVGYELFLSDGSFEGTRLVKNIGADDLLTLSSRPRALTSFKDRLYFVARPFNGNDELWVSDGTGASRLRRFDGHEHVVHLTVSGDNLYALVDGVLWTTDGTSRLEQLPPPAGGVSDDTVIDEVLYELGQGLCRLNGRNERTCAPRLVRPTEVVRLGGQLFVAAADEVSSYEALWVTDFTDAGTRLVKTFRPEFGVGESPARLTPLGSHVYFIASDRDGGEGLWRSDGSEAGTELVRSFPRTTIFPNIWFLNALGDRLYFVTGQCDETFLIWTSDGTSAGTLPLRETPSRGCGPQPNWAAVGDHLFFSSIDTEHGLELWRTDGTMLGTRLVRDIAPGPESSEVTSLTAIGDWLVFTACDAYGCEPFISDGTRDGTERLADIAVGAASSSPFAFGAASGRVYVSADDAVHGYELWAVPVGDQPCPGDCGTDRRVTIEELITAVRIALGQREVAECAPLDQNMNGGISIDELIGAVRAALHGCRSISLMGALRP